MIYPTQTYYHHRIFPGVTNLRDLNTEDDVRERLLPITTTLMPFWADLVTAKVDKKIRIINKSLEKISQCGKKYVDL